MQFDIKYAYFNFLQYVSYESSSLNSKLSGRVDEDSESSDAEVWRDETTFCLQSSGIIVENPEEILTLHMVILGLRRIVCLCLFHYLSCPFVLFPLFLEFCLPEIL